MPPVPSWPAAARGSVDSAARLQHIAARPPRVQRPALNALIRSHTARGMNLWQAAKVGDIGAVAGLLDSGVDPNDPEQASQPVCAGATRRCCTSRVANVGRSCEFADLSPHTNAAGQTHGSALRCGRR